MIYPELKNKKSELDSYRFEFGKNWQRYSDHVNQERINEAILSLKNFLKVDTLQGKKFLDIGCGSGLFSLAAKYLGAVVLSFDYDQNSVLCTEKLKSIYFKEDSTWIIESGSILNEEYISSLGRFDVVYSWGVLHHTGFLQKALLMAAKCVENNGLLCIAIYNDQGFQSVFWKKIKRIYCSGFFLRLAVLIAFFPIFFTVFFIKGFILKRNFFYYFREYKKNRGMAVYYDWIDWLGGYPFEVAKPEKIIFLYKNLGFELKNLSTKNGSGCNEFLFKYIEKKE